MYLNSIEESITMKDLLTPMCGKRKAFVYVIDKEKDFIRDIQRHEDKLLCQNIYFSHYHKIGEELMLEPDDLLPEQKIGHVFVHPTADIHHTAIVKVISN